MKTPSFFIVGAMKAGTTSLFDALCKHPKIFMPVEKEPFYYVWSTTQKEFVLPSPDGLISSDRWKIFDNYESYIELFSDMPEGSIAGEASTFYLPHKEAAEGIKADFPNAKIIIILREPVSRAYSAYNFQVSFGLEPAATFSEAIEDELSGNRNDWLYGWRHIYCSTYSEQVKRYMKCFGKKNVLILSQDELKNNQQTLLNNVCIFLGIKPITVQDSVGSNITAIPSNNLGKLVRLLFSRPNIIKDSIKKYIPLGFRRKIKSYVMAVIVKYSKKPERIEPELKQKLRAYFIEDIKSLEEITGKDFSLWYK